MSRGVRLVSIGRSCRSRQSCPSLVIRECGFRPTRYPMRVCRRPPRRVPVSGRSTVRGVVLRWLRGAASRAAPGRAPLCPQRCRRGRGPSALRAAGRWHSAGTCWAGLRAGPAGGRASPGSRHAHMAGWPPEGWRSDQTSPAGICVARPLRRRRRLNPRLARLHDRHVSLPAGVPACCCQAAMRRRMTSPSGIGRRSCRARVDGDLVEVEHGYVGAGHRHRADHLQIRQQVMRQHEHHAGPGSARRSGRSQWYPRCRRRLPGPSRSHPTTTGRQRAKGCRCHRTSNPLGQDSPGGGYSVAVTATESRVTAPATPWLWVVRANPASTGPVMGRATVEPGTAV